MADLSIQFLGTGTSCGVPMIGCSCPVCTSTDPHNRRWRSSIYVKTGALRVLVDVSPDFRMQAMEHGIERVDALLLTHAHVDHLFGLDDIRRINTIQNAPITLYASPEGVADVRRIFDYVFRESVPGTYRPKLELRPVENRFELTGSDGTVLNVVPVDVVHGWSRTFGYRVEHGNKAFAYVPDCHEIPDGSLEVLSGLDLLIIDTLRYRPHPTHFSLDESLAAIGKLRPRRTLLTHIGHDIDHATLAEELARRGFRNVAPAYDGLEVIV